MIFIPVSQSEFDNFVAQKDYKSKTVDVGGAHVVVFYDTETYHPSHKDAFMTVSPDGTTYHIRSE